LSQPTKCLCLSRTKHRHTLKTSLMKRPRHLLELLVILITVIGFNLGRITPKLSAFAAIVACISLLTWATIVFTSEDQFKIAKFGFTLILIRVVMPFVALIMTLVFYMFIYETPEVKAPQVLAQKVHPIECTTIRYGHFKAFNDTIVRLRSGNIDLEIRNGIDTFNVVWMDSCVYRVSKSRRLLEFYRIIDINNNRIFLEKMKGDLKKELILQTKID
jgi:hypothetical protein